MSSLKNAIATSSDPTTVEGTELLGIRASAELRLHMVNDRLEVGLGVLDAVVSPIAPDGKATLDNVVSLQISAGVRFD